MNMDKQRVYDSINRVINNWKDCNIQANDMEYLYDVFEEIDIEIERIASRVCHVEKERNVSMMNKNNLPHTEEMMENETFVSCLELHDKLSELMFYLEHMCKSKDIETYIIRMLDNIEEIFVDRFSDLTLTAQEIKSVIISGELTDNCEERYILCEEQSTTPEERYDFLKKLVGYY